MSRRVVLAAAVSLSLLGLATRPAAAVEISSQQQTTRQLSSKTIGPWNVIAWVAPNGVGYCSAERDVGQTRIGFVRFKQGFSLIVRSPTWQLQPTGYYPVKLSVASVTSHTTQGRVLAANILMVELASDPGVIRQMASGQTLDLVAADTEIAVPLVSFGDALTELETCIAQAPQPGQPAAPPTAQPAPPAPQPPARDPQPQDPTLPVPFPGTPGSKFPQ